MKTENLEIIQPHKKFCDYFKNLNIKKIIKSTKKFLELQRYFIKILNMFRKVMENLDNL